MYRSCRIALCILLPLVGIAQSRAVEPADGLKLPDSAAAQVYVRYDPATPMEESLFPGLKFNLIVTMDQVVLPGRARAELHEVIQDPTQNEDNQLRAAFETVSPPTQTTLNNVKIERSQYRVVVRIGERASPIFYNLRFTLKQSPPNQPPVFSSTRMEIPVGTQDRAVVQIVPPSNAVVEGGNSKTLKFSIVNPFYDYQLRIVGYEIEDSEGLIESVQYNPATGSGVIDPPLPVPRRGRSEISIPVKGRLLGKFTTLTSPTCSLTIYYTDGYRTQTKIDPAFPLTYKLQYGLPLIFGFAFIGLAMGTSMRLLYVGVTSKKDVKDNFKVSYVSIILLVVVVLLSSLMGLELLSVSGSPLAAPTTPPASLLLGLLVGIPNPSELLKKLYEGFRKILVPDP